MAKRGRAVLLGQAGGWHECALTEGCRKAGMEVLCLPVTKLVSRMGGCIEPAFGVYLGGEREYVPLRQTDFVLVRALPGGSLEQIVYRMDALHVLEAWGCRVVNSAETIERSVDKFHASFLIQAAGIPTPKTFSCERHEDAMEFFKALGGDVVVKPLFGSEGKGILRISDPDLAYRTFRALDVTRSVYYMQEYLPSSGWDLRVLVLDGRVLGCIRRESSTWKTNISQGARAEAFPITEEIETLSLRAAETFAADFCGVDLYPTSDGFAVIEVNGIPGWRGFQGATHVPVAEEVAGWMLKNL